MQILPITVLGPYCFLILLLIKAATQYGAADGMLLLFQPKPEDWNHMLSLTVQFTFCKSGFGTRAMLLKIFDSDFFHQTCIEVEQYL